MQPYHAIDDGRWAEKRIGPERIKTTYAFRSLLDRHAHLALRLRLDRGAARSDPGHLRRGHPADARRQAPGRLGARAEDHGGGGAPGLHQRATPTACSPSGRRGRLAPGYKADLVLLDQDLTRIPPEAIERAAVRATVVGGRVVYQSK